jgi:hypothetical protein
MKVDFYKLSEMLKESVTKYNAVTITTKVCCTVMNIIGRIRYTIHVSRLCAT